MTVSFNYSTWITRYPELSTVTEPLATLYFQEATLYCDNTGASKITNEGTRATMLNMLTAHIAALNSVALGKTFSDPVGKLSSATQGSVSASFDNQIPGTAAWYAMTKYGMAYWQASAPYRTARIFPGVNRQMDPWALQ